MTLSPRPFRWGRSRPCGQHHGSADPTESVTGTSGPDVLSEGDTCPLLLEDAGVFRQPAFILLGDRGQPWSRRSELGRQQPQQPGKRLRRGERIQSGPATSGV